VSYVLFIWFASVLNMHNVGAYNTAAECRRAAVEIQQEYAVENLTTNKPIHTLCLPKPGAVRLKKGVPLVPDRDKSGDGSYWPNGGSNGTKEEDPPVKSDGHGCCGR